MPSTKDLVFMACCLLGFFGALIASSLRKTQFRVTVEREAPAPNDRVVAPLAPHVELCLYGSSPEWVEAMELAEDILHVDAMEKRNEWGSGHNHLEDYIDGKLSKDKALHERVRVILRLRKVCKGE